MSLDISLPLANRRDGLFDSQREIAGLLYSANRVMSEWNSGEDMRKQIRRLLRRATSMVNGGYRDLVRSRYYERNFEQS